MLNLKRVMDLELWVVSGNIWPSKEYQKGLQTLLYHQEENVLTQIPHWSGIGGLTKRRPSLK